MLKGREVIERLKSSECHPTVREILVHLAEDNSALKQEIIMIAQLMDQLTNNLLVMQQVTGSTKSLVDEIKRHRAPGMESEEIDFNN